MTISKKIILGALIPTGFLVLLSALVSLYLWNEYRSAKAVEELVSLIRHASKLVHELQKERGMSTGFIGSGGVKFASSLKKQRSATDSAVEAFRRASLVDVRDERLRGLLSSINEMLNRLGRIRDEVDELSIDKREVLTFYTELNRKLITLIGHMAHYSRNVHVGARIIALKEFSKAKDFEGIKRALLSVVFAQDRFDSEILLTFGKVAGKEDAHLESFMEIAPPFYISHFEKLRTRPEFREAKTLESLALSKMEGYGVDPEEWFRVQTKKINLLKEMEDFMLSNISGTVRNLSDSALKKFWFMIAFASTLTLTTGAFIRGIVRNVRKRIEEVVGEIAGAAKSMEFGRSLEGRRNDEFALLEKALSEMFGALDSVVKTLQSVMERVASGYFSQRVEGSFGGDIGKLVDNINTALERLQKAMESIKEALEAVSEGNLRVRVEGNYEGDLRDLADYVNSSLDNLQSLLRRVKEDILNVATNIASITTSVDETSEAIRQIAEETLKAKNKAMDMESAISTGRDRVKDMHSAMNDIVRVSGEVASITETIITIAEQTNLLALNAAIEAARAGELGRGFAVVADEVRRLAELSANAAKEIAGLLERNMNTVEIGRASAEHVVESYERIEEVVKEVSSSIDSIATAMEEQSRAIDIIRDNITDISKSTERIEKEMKKFEV